MIKRNINKSLEWVAIYTTAKDAIICSTPEQVKIFALLIVNMGLYPNSYVDGIIPLTEIENDNFPLRWGISEGFREILMKSSPLWERTDTDIHVPLYAYDKSQKILRMREGGRKGGKAKERNRRKNATRAAAGAMTSNSQQNSEYSFPEHLTRYIQEDDTDN